MQKFLQGATNHLAWVMVDATDFAAPESALSAATTIKIYGKLNTAAGVNFVSSGTGSLTNDIVHVGASATGIYTIALAPADLSDASAAFYDMYIVHLSGTGAARQTIIASGVRTDTSYISNVLSHLSAVASDIYSAMTVLQSRALLTQSRVSDIQSYLVVMSGVQSDIYSLLSDVGSDVIVMSNILSQVLGDTSGLAGADLSDIGSAVWAQKYTAHSAASTFGSLMSDIYSRAGGAVTASDISDIASAVWATALATKLVTLNSSDMSDLRSAIAAGPAATVTASDISDIASAVWATALATKIVTLNTSDMSDLRSAIAAGPAGALTVSDISDIASAVRATLVSDLSDIYSAATQTNSRALVLQSMVSDVDSALTSRFSNLESLVTVTGVQLNASSLSDLRSAITAGGGGGVTASDISDIASAVRATMASDLSDIYSAATQINSRALVNQSRVSDIYSLLSDVSSDIGVMSGVQSDVYSALLATLAMLDDARGEPGQGAPPVNPDAMTKLDYLYQAFRNKITQTATTFVIYADNGTTSNIRATVSDDTTTFTRGELGTGA